MSTSNSNSPLASHNKSKSTTALTGSRNNRSNERRRSSATSSTTLLPPNTRQSPRPSISASNISCKFHDEAECKPQHHQNQHKSMGGIPQPLCTCMCHSLPMPQKLLTASSSTDSLATDNTSRPGSPASTTSYSHLEAAHTELQRKYEIRRNRENELRQLLNTVLGENAMLKNKLTHLENIFNEIDDSK